MDPALTDDSDEEELRRLGRQIFEWADGPPPLTIRRDCNEPFLIRGSFHLLADEMRLHWHPRFEECIGDGSDAG
jgi:hypothetical protein